VVRLSQRIFPGASTEDQLLVGSAIAKAVEMSAVDVRDPLLGQDRPGISRAEKCFQVWVFLLVQVEQVKCRLGSLPHLRAPPAGLLAFADTVWPVPDALLRSGTRDIHLLGGRELL